MTVSQDGPLFRLSWTLDTPEAVTIARVLPEALELATVTEDVTTFVDTIDTLDTGDAVSWTVTGVTSLAVIELEATAADLAAPPTDAGRRYLAAVMVAHRIVKRRDAPLGFAGGGELGPVAVRRYDPDVDELLAGLRRTDSDLSLQTWPTIDEIRAAVRVSAGELDDTELGWYRTSAIEIVTRRCRAGFGVS